MNIWLVTHFFFFDIPLVTGSLTQSRTDSRMNIFKLLNLPHCILSHSLISKSCCNVKFPNSQSCRFPSPHIPLFCCSCLRDGEEMAMGWELSDFALFYCLTAAQISHLCISEPCTYISQSQLVLSDISLIVWTTFEYSLFVKCFTYNQKQITLIYKIIFKILYYYLSEMYFCCKEFIFVLRFSFFKSWSTRISINCQHKI